MGSVARYSTPSRSSRIASYRSTSASEPAGRSVPGRSVPGRSVPDWSVPGWSVPGWSVPGWSVPGSSVPGWSVPGWSVPSASITGKGSPRQAGQGALVVLDPGTHGDGQLEVRDGAGSLTRPLAAQGQREVRVVVHGVDGDGLGELPAGPRGAPAHEQGATQGLADRGLLRLHEPGPRQEHRGLMGMPVLQEPAPLAEQLVRGLALDRGAIPSGCLGSHRSPAFCSTRRGRDPCPRSPRRRTTPSAPSTSAGSTLPVPTMSSA